jgi:hypothetical protein
MTFFDAHSGWLADHHSRPRASLVPRLLAIAQGPALDAELAGGIRPSSSLAHRLRAEYLRRPRVRLRIARALDRAVAEAGRAVPPFSVEIPLSGEAINHCSAELRALAKAVATLEEPRTRGLAIAHQLAFDGSGPLFARPSMADGRARLANTVQAARMALRVSSVFDAVGA